MRAKARAHGGGEVRRPPRRCTPRPAKAAARSGRAKSPKATTRRTRPRAHARPARRAAGALACPPTSSVSGPAQREQRRERRVGRGRDAVVPHAVTGHEAQVLAGGARGPRARRRRRQRGRLGAERQREPQRGEHVRALEVARHAQVPDAPQLATAAAGSGRRRAAARSSRARRRCSAARGRVAGRQARDARVVGVEHDRGVRAGELEHAALGGLVGRRASRAARGDRPAR